MDDVGVHNGPEYISGKLMAWAEKAGIHILHIQPGNPRVTVDRLIEGWGDRTGPVCSGRHILAIQDTSEINFKTTVTQHRGLGKIGKGMGHGLLLHAMLAVDADNRIIPPLLWPSIADNRQ